MATPLLTVADLAQDVERGRNVEFLFFWGHHPRPDGSIGPSCLSQWWPAPFVVDGLAFRTAEHYMMWRKATLFDDAAIAEQVLTATDLRQVKALGRKVHGFEPGAWEASRVDIVVTGNLAKFQQNDDLCAYLLSTGDRVIVEASPVDSIWGIGLAADDPRACEPAQWRGLNLLGFALTHVRTTLRSTSR